MDADRHPLCHEFCHHLDFHLFGFPDSWHTRGFYERTAALYHDARSTERKPLFWRPLPGGRWRIDWQRTRRFARKCAARAPELFERERGRCPDALHGWDRCAGAWADSMLALPT